MTNFSGIPDEKASFTARCIKGAFIVLNVQFLIKSLLIAILAVSGKVAVNQFFVIFDYYYDIDDFFDWWIASGCSLFFVSIFGIALSYRKNTKIAIIYGIALSAVLIVQIKTVNRSVVLTGYSSGIVSTNLHKYMQSYRYVEDVWRRSKIDWLQTTLTCCGNNSPTDWYGVYSVNSSFTSPTLPISCCANDAIYGNAFCKNRYTIGCYEPLYFIVASTLLNIAKFGLFLAVIQVVTIINTILLASVYKRKTLRQNFQGASTNESFYRSTEGLITTNSTTRNVNYI